MALEPGTRLGHYEVVSSLGAGGMGEVYRAKDTKLGREVAIKVLLEEVSGDRDRLARFAREAQLLAALNHPNIVTLFNIEESEGLHFLVMELVEGQTLERFIPAGGMAANTLIDLARPLVEAVAAAHERRITHRDLKPGNVIVGDDGRVRVLDFGLAKLDRRQDSNAETAPTATAGGTHPGTVLGTWAYMSPEQAEGRPADARSDVFSLGVMLYEMATGQRPFSGANPARLLSSILRDEPRPIDELRRDLPPRLGAMISRCLDKDPDRRFADGVALAAALSGAGATPMAQTAVRLPQQQQSIAVLPFANHSSDGGDEFFSDGITEEIINALAKLKGLRVAARTSAFSFKGQAIDIAGIAQRLNVANILEGSVRRAGNRLRITAQLVDVADGCQLWSERFDREMDDIFAVQDEIAQAIVAKFEPHAAAKAPEPMVLRPTDNLEAYESYLRGRHAWEAGLAVQSHTTLQHFQRAVELDPSFAAAWAAVADAYGHLAFSAAMAPDEAMPLSKQAAEKALSLDDSLAEAHCALGHWHLIYGWNWDEARACLLRSIDLNPNYPQALHHYGHLYCGFVSFELDEGIELCRRAAEVDPLGGFAKHGWMADLYIKGCYAEAIDWLTAELEREPSAFHLRRLLGLCYLEQERFDEAQQTLEEAIRTSGRHPWAVAELGALHGRAGRIEKAEAFQAELLARSHTSAIQGTTLAMIPSNIGRFDEAYGWLDRGAVEHDPILFAITTWPTLRPLRQDPRYGNYLERLGLRQPPGWL